MIQFHLDRRKMATPFSIRQDDTLRVAGLLVTVSELQHSRELEYAAQSSYLPLLI